MPGDIPSYVVPVGELSIPGVTVAAHKVLLPVELEARALELREVRTTHGNNVESCGVVSLGAVAWTCAGVGTVVGAVVGPAPGVVVGWETKGNACRADDNLRTHHCSESGVGGTKAATDSAMTAALTARRNGGSLDGDVE